MSTSDFLRSRWQSQFVTNTEIADLIYFKKFRPISVTHTHTHPLLFDGLCQTLFIYDSANYLLVFREKFDLYD